MKLIATAVLILTATITQAANTFERCWLSPIDELDTVTFSRSNIRPLHPVGTGEVLRARSIQRPTEITGTYVDEIDGTTNNIYTAIADKYLLWNGTALVGMTQEQRETRDAYDIAQATVQIPPTIVAIGNQYVTLMETYFGAGSATNEYFSEGVVAASFLLNPDKTDQMTIDSATISASFQMLKGFWGKESIWNFPYNKASYVGAIQ